MSHHTLAAENPDKHWTWKNRPGYKPVLFIIAAILFTALVLAPPPQNMLKMIGVSNPPGYKIESGCSTITDTINKKLRPNAFAEHKNGISQKNHAEEVLLTEREVANLAKLTIAILFLAAFLWGTEAIPLGATDIMVGVLLYLFAILPLNDISKAYMTDAVFFIFGILAVAVGVAKTGLDKRIGLILLSRIKSTKAFAFIFLPLLSISAGFLSEHALVALLIPV